MKRILLFTDKNGITNFRKAVEATQLQCNFLINTFEAFQDFLKVTAIQQFYDLVTDPVDYFDKILTSAVDLKITNNKLPNPEILAQLIGIDRKSFVQIINGESVTDTACQPCKKLLKVRKGSPVITLSEYENYSDYLIFDSGSFSLNEDRIKEHLKTFQIYCENENQVATYKYWTNVVTVLNSLSLSPDFLVSLQSKLSNRLMFSYADNKLHIDEKSLYHEILKTK